MYAAGTASIFFGPISLPRAAPGIGQLPAAADAQRGGRRLRGAAKEEAAAFEALRAGDSAAREKIIQHNLRLVAHIAKKYYALPSDQDDLISIGTIGLIKAVNTFDSTRRARFSTYASRCIENEILSPRPFWRTWLEKRGGFSGSRRGGASLDKLRPVSSF